ncbi:glucoamylase family protein [Acetobacter conturbans]|uniref:Tat pathway signal protein n=1 Tax=Acetobacter conturbans TaxID=1737472 RepID=A0ABX0JYU7_9PROT|nr:glucoamylase family protein [Acetobacter conturbans]NHN88682.1 Tat pathway signal protein [Acetobacter conturbans]
MTRSASIRRWAAAVLLTGIAGIVQDHPAWASQSSELQAPGGITASDRALIDDLEHRTFLWFWQSADPHTGLVPDRYPSPQTFASVASIGFGLTAYGIGVERQYITREQAVGRTLATLRFLLRLPQNDSPRNAAGFHGFFYHFLDEKTGLRLNPDIELSSIDTALLIEGVLFTESFYDRDNADEKEIRSLAGDLYRRVDWQWMKRPDERLSMGWGPEHQFLPNYWEGYCEGMMAYILGLGSPDHALQPVSWQAWLATNDKRWGSYYGQTFLNFAPLFGHQYSHAWIDFRGIQDDWARGKSIDYFENSRRAVYAQQAYATANPGKWKDYSGTIWGLTASDGPGEMTKQIDGQDRHFLSYSARGAGRDYVQDDGTIAPTAALGSIAFAPEIVIPALRDLRSRYGDRIYGKYGFMDAFNPSFPEGQSFWVDNEYLGIDQGPILLMIENWRSGFVWNVMKRNPYIRTGLLRAGFHGAWLGKEVTDAAAHAPGTAKAHTP